MDSGLDPASPSQVPLKRRRITRACDRCHRGGIKCSAGPRDGACGPCSSFGSECTYERPTKRRGPPARGGHVAGDNAAGRASSSGSDRGRREEGWSAKQVAGAETIEELVDAYHRIVYPILPYFHWPTFSYDVRRRRYLHDRPFYAAVMAVCAVTAARLADGAKLPASQRHEGSSDDTHLAARSPPSEVFHDAVLQAIPRDLLAAGDFDYKRAKGLILMLCFQYGRVKEVKLHLGELVTMCDLEVFHNESRWPAGLNAIEVEERRRVFWSIYQVDIYTAVIWGGVAHLRESQITVAYPIEVIDDAEITPSGFIPSSRPGAISFFRGWNFVCTLYRILEHATDRLRANRAGNAVDEVSALYTDRKAGPDPTDVLGTVAGMYNDLPMIFKRVKDMTGNLDEDIYGFTAANIIITLQTLRSVIAGTEEANVHQRCTIAAEMLDALASVPASYIQAASAPMIHHLAGVGHLLGSIIQSPVSQHTYLRVRTVLLALADMLASLEAALSRDSGIATRLRAHVSRIDTYMNEAAEECRTGVNGNVALSAERSAPTAAKPNSNDGDGYKLDPGLLPGNYRPHEFNIASPSLPFPQPTHLPLGIGLASPGNRNPAAYVLPQVPAADWAPVANVPPNQQFQLPDDLFQDWPFDAGHGDVFDWLGDLTSSGTDGNQAVLPLWG